MSVIVFVGVCCFVGGLVLLFKEMLTSPRSVNFPTHPWYVRLAGAAWGTVLVYRGFVVLWGCAHGHPRLDDNTVVYSSFCMVSFIVARFVETWDSYAPARAWRRMQQIQTVMRCRRWGWARRLLGLPPEMDTPDPERAAIASMLTKLDGQQVIAPNEVPKEWQA